MDALDVDAGAAVGCEPEQIFTYGTLGPRFRPDDGPWVPDSVRGRLFDLGSYPGLVHLDEPSAGWVQGHVRRLRGRELTESLDHWESVETGLFRRVIARTRLGRSVWVYVYGPPLPASARECPGAWRPSASARVWSGPTPEAGGRP